MKGTTCMTYHLSEEAIRTRFHDAIRSTKQGKYGNEVIPGERAGLRPICARSRSARQLCPG